MYGLEEFDSAVNRCGLFQLVRTLPFTRSNVGAIVIHALDGINLCDELRENFR